MAASFGIHFYFKMHDYGEGDACEMGNMALELHQTGTLHEYSYRIRTSVLYIHNAGLRAFSGGADFAELLSLLGMMTGVILGGNDPLTAIGYQIAIMLSIFTGTSITVILAILFSARSAFNAYGMLKPEIFK